MPAKREAIEAYQAGRLILRELGRSLGLDVWGAHDLLASEGVAVSGVSESRPSERWSR